MEQRVLKEEEDSRAVCETPEEPPGHRSSSM